MRALAVIATLALVIGLSIGANLPPPAPQKPWPPAPENHVLVCFDRTGHPTTGPDWAECRSVKL